MKRRKSKAKYKVFLIAILVIAVIAAMFPRQGRIDYRPEYCKEDVCIPKIVFEKLPDYPKDFPQVDLMVEYGMYRIVENFTPGIPDENYYKQPEFYPEFETQGVDFYIKPPTGYLGVIGYGAYPGDIVIKPVRAGQDLVTVTYFHASWGIVKYQGFGLGIEYPEEGSTEMGLFQVKQEPEKVKNYFEVNITPTYLLLEPTYPVFFQGWTQKVRTEIHIKENTPPGKYLIGISPIPPPPEIEERWLKELKLKYTGVGMVGIGRPPYQIFIEVVE